MAVGEVEIDVIEIVIEITTEIDAAIVMTTVVTETETAATDGIKFADKMKL